MESRFQGELVLASELGSPLEYHPERMNKRLHSLGPKAAAVLRASVTLQLLWLAIAPMQHLLSHRGAEIGLSEAACLASSPLDDSAPASQGSTQHPACAICVLFSANLCFHAAPLAAALDLNQTARPTTAPLPQVAESEYSNAIQARAPPLA